jgi:hypothetical protein
MTYWVLLSLLLAEIPVSGEKGDEDFAGHELLGRGSYSDFERPEACGSCHIDIYQQWLQAMMSQSYTHHWDEIEYFDLAVKHAEKESKVADVKAGCNGCHAPTAFWAGDVPPPRPAEKSRANEGVSCDVCHSIKGFKGEVPYNYNYILKPGRTKYGNRAGVESPHHKTEYSEFMQSGDFCGTCHNEKSPFDVWVKSTHLEWKEGPYFKEGVLCQDCHMPPAPGRNAQLAQERNDVRQHLFHGAHSPSKLLGAVELRIHPDVREIEPGEPVILKVQAFNHKAGHKIPSGSAEERQLWLTVMAYDSKGMSYHLPVDKKGFAGEEFTISSKAALAYQDLGEIMEIQDFPGLLRDDLPHEGDRIFRLPYFDPQNRMTIAQWNTASLGTDYRIGPRETKIEQYTWTIPDNVAEGSVRVEATLYYRKLVKSVGEFLKVPDNEMKEFVISQAETWFAVVY